MNTYWIEADLDDGSHVSKHNLSMNEAYQEMCDLKDTAQRWRGPHATAIEVGNDETGVQTKML